MTEANYRSLLDEFNRSISFFIFLVAIKEKIRDNNIPKIGINSTEDLLNVAINTT